MSTFKIKLKLTGLDIDIEGSREDIPAIAANLGQQLTGLLAPAAALASEDDVMDAPVHREIPPLIQEVKQKRQRRKPSPKSASSETSAPSSGTLDFRHDSSKYGAAQQGWNTAKKSMWLLHIASEMGAAKEMSGGSIATTFNKHFRQAGMIQAFNVNRDLGKLKIKSSNGKPAVVGEDTTKSPSAWYLTEEGNRQAQELVAEALGRKKS